MKFVHLNTTVIYVHTFFIIKLLLDLNVQSASDMFLSQKLLKQQSYQKEDIVHPRVRVNTFKSITRQIIYISTTSFKDDP